MMTQENYRIIYALLDHLMPDRPSERMLALAEFMEETGYFQHQIIDSMNGVADAAGDNGSDLNDGYDHLVDRNDFYET